VVCVQMREDDRVDAGVVAETAHCDK